MFQTKNTITELVNLLEEMPVKSQAELLRQLKLKKALQMARKIDSTRKPKLKISDQEIADIVHAYRKSRKVICLSLRPLGILPGVIHFRAV